MGTSRSHKWGFDSTPDWRALNAGCLRPDVDPALFHPSGAVTKENAAKAKEVCETQCPKSCFDICKEYVLSMKNSHMEGVMAGLTPAEQRALRKERQKAG